MKLKVGLSYNLFEDFPVKEKDPDDIAIEWCDRAYINLLRNGIEAAGFEVVDIGSPLNLMDNQIRDSMAILFSIAEMRGYRYRESLVPVLCEFFELPYLFARPDGMLITADKQMSNLVAERLGVPVPAWQLIKNKNTNLQMIPSFPCIIKPNAEGGSMGIHARSVVSNLAELEAQVTAVLDNYKEPAMIQQYIAGQEITVAVIQENGKTRALEVLEVFDETAGAGQVFSREIKQSFKKGHLFRAVKSSTDAEIIRFWAEQIFDEIGCCDAARIDFRKAGDKFYFIEINGLTDFHPDGAFCQSANFAGLPYEKLLKIIILNAYDRFKRD
jgi:D-alanine-D-alanine ligase